MRKIMSLILTSTCIFGLIGSVQASGYAIDGDDDTPSNDAIQASEYADIKKDTRDAFPLSDTISVPLCTQEKGNYCGPATVQQVMKYNMGTKFTKTQTQIANAIGTTSAGSSLSPMVDYIRNNTTSGFAGYKIYSKPTITEMRYITAATIYFFGAPPIARLVYKEGGNWPYDTNGHYLNVSGYNYGDFNNPQSAKNKVRVTDPNIKRVRPSSDGTYWVTLNELYKATTVDSYSKEYAGALQ